MGTTQGRDWLDMRPGHFDVRELPKFWQRAPAGAIELFSVADVAPAAPKASQPGEMDGQADLLSLLED